MRVNATLGLAVATAALLASCAQDASKGTPIALVDGLSFDEDTPPSWTQPDAGPAVDAPPEDDLLDGDASKPQLPPCAAHAAGSFHLAASGGEAVTLEYTGAVYIEAQHVEPDGCLTEIRLKWAREGGCTLTLGYAPGANGIWALTEASMEAGEDCGGGFTGLGESTLSGVPLVTAPSPPPLRCTVLAAPIVAHGLIEVEPISPDGQSHTLKLENLSVDGMLLSKAFGSGACGAPYAPCPGQTCGVDPLLGVSCGSCGASEICEGGQCVGVDPVVAVCTRVLEDRAYVYESDWNGAVGTCEAGEMDLAWQERALRSTNLYRWLAGQPPLSLVTTANEAMQDCAVMMHAASSLSHNPSEAWPCYTEGGASAASKSNLAPVPAVEAVDLYMADPGNATTIGHRRWILSDWISTTSFGSTSSRSCMRVVKGFGGPTPWIAWPPPGYYPMELHDVAYQTIDQTGWTIQTNGVSLTEVSATIAESGVQKPVEVVALGGNYGSQGAIKITPSGWGIQPGATYAVTASTPSHVIDYEFQAVDCSEILKR